MRDRMKRKKQALNKTHKNGRVKGLWKIKKLFDIYTGKKAPDGASKSEQYITFHAYVQRHVRGGSITKLTYVNVKTGEPAPGITKETHQRGKHTTLYGWQTSQKYAEFSEILAAGGDLPPVPFPPIKKGEKLQTLFDIDTGKKAPAGTSKSEKYITLNAYVKRHVDSSQSARITYVDAETGKPAPGITIQTHQSGEHTTLYSWHVSQKYAEFSKIIKEGGNLPPAPLRNRAKRVQVPAADAPKTDLFLTHASFALPLVAASSLSADPLIASGHTAVKSIEIGKPQSLTEGLTEADTDQASVLSSPDIEKFVDNMLSADSFSAAESDMPVLAPPTESDLTEHTVTAAGEPSPSLSETATENQVDIDFDLYFSPPAFSLLPTIPLHASLAEASDAAIRPRSDPAISAAQGSFEQSPIQKRKPNLHSFFKSEANDRIRPASKIAKKMASDGSAKHSLPVPDAPDLVSEVAFIRSQAAKMPTL